MRRKKLITVILMMLVLTVSAVSLAACKNSYTARHEIPGIQANSAELYIEHDRLTFARGMEIDDAKIIVACGAVVSDAEGNSVAITEKYLRDKIVGYEKFNLSTAGGGRKIKVSYKKAEYYIYYDVLDFSVNFYLDEGHTDLWKNVTPSAAITQDLDLSVWVNTAEYNYSTDEPAKADDPDGTKKFSGWYTLGGEAVTGSYTLKAPTIGYESVLNVHADYLTDEEYGALDLSYDSRGRRVFGGYKGADTESVTVPEGVTYVDIRKIFSNSPNVTHTGFTKLHIPSTAELDIPLGNILNTVGLAEITVDKGNPRYSSYNGGLYSKSFKSLYLMPASNTNVELYGELVTVERYSCAYLQATKLVLPDSVQNLNSYCFAFSKLTEVDDYTKVPSIQAGVFYGTTIASHEDYDDSGNLIAIYTELGDGKYSLSVIVDKTITEYSLIKGTTAIAGDAFNKCENLASVNLGSELETIGGSAFAGCTSLTNVSLPSTVKYIGSAAFRDCTSLEKVTGLGDITFSDTKDTRHHTIPDRLFYGCGKLKAVNSESGLKLDDKIIEIGSQAFYGCKSFTSIVVPSALEVIGSYAFHTCSGIEEFDLPDTLTKIGNYAFYQSGLSSINLEKLTKVTELGLRCFAYTKLTEVKIPSWIEEIPDYCFYYINTLLKVDMGNVTSVGAYAFSYCQKLYDIMWSEKLTEIGERAFRYCNALVDVVIPDSVRYIGGYAFANSTKLETLHVGKDLRTFGEYPMESEFVFGDVQPAIFTNAKLRSITVSEENEIFKSIDGVLYGSEVGGENVGQYSVLYIVPSNITLGGGSTTFTTDAATKWILPYSIASNATVTEIVLSDGVETIGKGAFYNSQKLTKLHLSASVSYIGASILLNCKGIEEVTMDPANETYSMGDGILYTKDGKSAVMFFGTATEIVLSSTLEKVDDAFFMNTKITSVVIPDSVKTIGYQAFKGCEKLTTITIGSGLESFDPTAFAQLPNLETISVSDANPNFKVVDNILYSKDGKTLYLCPAKSGMTALTIPSDVTTIADWAFAYHATLSEVVLPKDSNVEIIGSYAFYECRNISKFFGGEKLRTIGERAFSFATAISSTTGEMRCNDALKSVLVYAGVKVGDNAFYGQYGIENLFLKMTDVELSAFLNAAGTNIAFLTRGCSTGAGGYYNNDGLGVNRYLYSTSAPLQPLDGYGWFYFLDEDCMQPTPGV